MVCSLIRISSEKPGDEGKEQDKDEEKSQNLVTRGLNQSRLGRKPSNLSRTLASP